MVVKHKLSSPQLFELRDHKNNTVWELIKVYTASQLSYMDWIDERTVKTSSRYLPVRVDSWPWLYRFKAWESSKPYRVMYIRLDEVRTLFNKRTRKKLVIE